MTGSRKHFRIETDSNGIATVWIDVAEHSMNVFDDSVIKDLQKVVGELEARHPPAVVFRSAKATGFFAGADVKKIASLQTTAEVEEVLTAGQQLFARIAGLPMPTIAAIHGPCLGGGLEFALACSYRIAMDSSATRLGLPEVQLGFIPGWGGTQRLPKQIGIVDALPMILQGKKLSAARALKVGLVDAVADAASWGKFVTSFAASVAGASGATPVRLGPHGNWKKRLLRTVAATRFGRWLVLRSAKKHIARDAGNYPALPAALRSVNAGFDKHGDGFSVERAEFTKLIATPTCRNLLNLFLWRETARSLDLSGTHQGAEAAVEQPAAAVVRTIGVIGAGAMGAGIGQLAALKGLNVILKELDPELAVAGMNRVASLLDNLLEKKQLTSGEREEVLGRVSATSDFTDMSECDLVIEAVVENMAVKKAVFASLDRVLKAHAIIVSNTSALSVTEMAAASNRPDRVAGLHFFNPVHRMDLVEIVKAAGSSNETVTTLLNLVKKLGKTPVVTSDSPGFLVNRVLFPYIDEAVRMVMEGQSPTELDREVKRFGMPMGPIELIDHVGIDVAWHVAETLKDVLPESDEVIRLLGSMVARGWIGRKSGRGFYEYVDDKCGVATDLSGLNLNSAATINGSPSTVVISAAREATGDHSDAQYPAIGAFLPDGLTDIQRRLIYPMINEVGFCMQSHVVAESWMADLAMILGTGFAPFRGGPMVLADSIGLETLKNNFHVLAARHGERFKPSAWLITRGRDAAAGEGVELRDILNTAKAPRAVC